MNHQKQLQTIINSAVRGFKVTKKISCVSIHLNEQFKKEINKTISYHPKEKLLMDKFSQGGE